MECPVCMEEMDGKKVVSLCSHVCCSTCTVRIITQSGGRQFPCSICRRTVSFLIISNPEGPDQQEQDTIRRYNQRFGDNRSYIQMMRDLPYLLDTFYQQVVSTRGAILLSSLSVLGYILGAIIYTLSPFDLVPEAVFGLFGLIDDAIAILLTLISIATFVHQTLMQQNERILQRRR